MFPPKNIDKLSQLAILKKVDELKTHIDSLRPFPVDVEGRVLQKLRFDWNYHSNAIEGNSLNYGETRIFLMEGLTAKGKPLKDHLDIRGHNTVVNFLLDIVKEKREISEVDIRGLHQGMLVENYYVPAITPDGKPTRKLIKIGEYKTEPNHVEMLNGELHYYASPEEVPARMYELINWYKEAKQNTEIHPIVMATLFHYEFVAIHPFADGNGRMSRWLMNLVLLQKHYPVTVLKQEKRKQYYAALQESDIGNFTNFVEFVAEAVLHSLEIYQKAINGENINELDDLDKEIVLFKASFQKDKELQIQRSSQNIYKVLDEQILSFYEALQQKIKQFDELFFEREDRILLTENNEGYNMLATKYWDLIRQNWLVQNNNFSKNIIYKFNYELIFKGFKYNGVDSFDVTTTFNINFQEYHYELYSERGEVIKKAYSEILTEEEKQLLIVDFVRYVKSIIENKVKIK